MEFSSQEYWSGLPCAPPGDLPDPGIEPRSPALQADSLPSEPPGMLIVILRNYSEVKFKLYLKNHAMFSVWKVFKYVWYNLGM